MDTPPLSAVQQAIYQTYAKTHPDVKPEMFAALTPDDMQEWLDLRMGSTGEKVPIPTVAGEVGHGLAAAGHFGMNVGRVAAGPQAGGGPAASELAQGIGQMATGALHHAVGTFLTPTQGEDNWAGNAWNAQAGLPPIDTTNAQTPEQFGKSAQGSLSDVAMLSGNPALMAEGAIINPDTEHPIADATSAAALGSIPTLVGGAAKGSQWVGDRLPTPQGLKATAQRQIATAIDNSAGGAKAVRTTQWKAADLGKKASTPLAASSPELGALAEQYLGDNPAQRAQYEALWNGRNAETGARMGEDLMRTGGPTVNAANRLETLSKDNADWASSNEGWPGVYKDNPSMQLTPGLDQLFKQPETGALFKRAERLQMMGPDMDPYVAAVKKFNQDVADATRRSGEWDQGVEATTRQLQDEAASLQKAWDQRASSVAREHIAQTKIAQQEWDQRAANLEKASSAEQTQHQARLDNLQSQMSSVAPTDPLFQQAMQNFGIPEKPPAIVDPVKQLGPRPKTPTSADAYQHASDLIGKRPVAPTPEQIQRIVDKQHGQRPTIPDTPPDPSAEMIHKTRMAIDDVIRTGSKPGANGAQKALAGEFMPIRDQIDAYLRGNAQGFARVNDIFSARKGLEGAIETGRNADIAHQPVMGADEIWKADSPARVEALVGRVSNQNVEGVGLSPRDEMQNALRSHLLDDLRAQPPRLTAADLTPEALKNDPTLEAKVRAALGRQGDYGGFVARAKIESLGKNVKIPAATAPGSPVPSTAPWYMKYLITKTIYNKTLGKYRSALAVPGLDELFSPGMPKNPTIMNPQAPPGSGQAAALAAMLTARQGNSNAP